MAAKKPGSGSEGLSVTVQKAAGTIGGPPQWVCLECHEVMEVHQPDAANPARLLGTCPECGAWHVLDFEESLDEPECLMLRIPDADTLKRERGENPDRAQLRLSGSRRSARS